MGKWSPQRGINVGNVGPEAGCLRAFCVGKWDGRKVCSGGDHAEHLWVGRGLARNAVVKRGGGVGPCWVWRLEKMALGREVRLWGFAWKMG